MPRGIPNAPKTPKTRAKRGTATPSDQGYTFTKKLGPGGVATYKIEQRRQVGTARSADDARKIVDGLNGRRGG